MVNSNVSLDVSKNGTQATVYVNQHEVESRSLVISLNNNGKKLFLPENYYVTAHAVIDGKTYSNEAKIENDKILFTFPSSYFDKSGKFELQVRIQRVSGEKSYILYSPKIQIIVSKSIYDSDAVTGTTEYDRFAYDIQRMLTSQIDSIEETVEDKKHTYTVKFKAGNSQTFIIYDGKDGKDGKNGVDAVEGIKKIIYNGSELAVSDDKTVEFNAQPYIKEFDFINDESEIEKLAIGKLYIVTKEMNVDGFTYYPGSLIMQTSSGIAGFGNPGFVLNGDVFPLWSEIRNGITFKKTPSGYEVSIDGKKTELILPTKTSELQNDSGYITADDVPPEVYIGSSEPQGNEVIWVDNTTNPENINATKAYVDEVVNLSKTRIVTNTENTVIPAFELADNTEYRFTLELESIEFTLPDNPTDDYISSIVFKSGATATTITYPDTIKWSGDDISSDKFVPASSKTYEVLIYWNGFDYCGIVKGW